MARDRTSFRKRASRLMADFARSAGPSHQDDLLLRGRRGSSGYSCTDLLENDVVEQKRCGANGNSNLSASPTKSANC